jgi:hypothetical protein
MRTIYLLAVASVLTGCASRSADGACKQREQPKTGLGPLAQFTVTKARVTVVFRWAGTDGSQ